MFDWMYQSREEFLLNYYDIGNSHTTSKELQEDHKCFSLSSMVFLLSLFILFIAIFKLFFLFIIGHVRDCQSPFISCRTSTR